MAEHTCNLSLYLMGVFIFSTSTSGNEINHNYNKILKSDLLSPVMIWALIGQCNWTGQASCLGKWTVRIRERALMDQLNLNKLFLFRTLQLKLLSIPSSERFLLFFLEFCYRYD